MRPQIGLYALIVLLNCFYTSVFVKSQGVDNIDEYYLDSLGHICTDTVDTVQKVEYDSQIHCTVSPMLVCDEDEEVPSKNSILRKRIGKQPAIRFDDDLLVEANDPFQSIKRLPQDGKQSTIPDQETGKQVCHTMNVKDCKTIHRPKESKVKVKVCPDDLPQATPTANELLFGELDPRFRRHRERSRRKQRNFKQGSSDTECDINGQRNVCKTKYKTECTTTEISHEVKEDYPNCKLEMTDKCDEKPDKFGNCKRVPAMKCKIETRVVVKTKPETKCKRVPREFCKKQNCTKPSDENRKDRSDDSGCYFMEKTVNEVVPEEKCTYTPKRICHQVDEGPQKVPRGGKKRSLVGLDAVKRRKRSALPPNNLDVELLALESNVIEGKESREGRQLQRFGALKKKGKRRRVVVKRKRQKLGRSGPVSRTIVPTTPSPTIDSKAKPAFSGADIFLSRRRQSITLDKDPKLSIAQPKQPFSLANPTASSSNSNFFIPASPAKAASADVSGTGAIKSVEKTNTPTDAERNIAETKAKLKHQQSVLKLQQLQQQLLHIQRQQQLQQRLQHQKIIDLEHKLLRARQNSEELSDGSKIPLPTPTPIQLTPSPILPTDNHRIDVEEDGSLKLSILIKESLKRATPKPDKAPRTSRPPASKPKFASFPTRIPHTLGPIPEATPPTVSPRTTPRLTRRPDTKKRRGTPTPRSKLSQETKRVVNKPPAISFGKSKKENEEIALQNALKSIEKQILGSKLKVEKDAKGRNCRELPKQNCQRLRVNPKPVWKNMTRKICRVPKTKLDKDLVQKLLERGDNVRSQRNAAHFHAIDGEDRQSQSSETRTSRAESLRSSRNRSRFSGSPRKKRKNRRRQGRNRKNGGSDDPPNFSPFLNFPKFPRAVLERNS